MADPNDVAPGTDAASDGDAKADTGYDHAARIRAGGEWAVDYLKKLESRADKAEREARENGNKFAALDRYTKAGLSDKDIAGHLGQMEKMLTDEKYGAAFKSYLTTGKLDLPKQSASQTDDEDEYLSDEMREIRALKAELAEVRSISHSSQLGLGQQAITRNLETVAGELKLSTDDLATVKKRAREIVQGWQGNADGRRALEGLQHPETGLETARSLVLTALGPEGLRKVYRAEFLREQQTRGGMATDSPSRGRLGGSQSNMPEFESILDAMEAARARPELLEEFGY